MDVITEQVQMLQTEIQETRDLLANDNEEYMSRQELKDIIECKEKQLTELQLDLDDTDELPIPLRRSTRLKAPTEKMLAYQMEDLSKRENKLLSTYEQWKMLIRTSRENLKNDMPEKDLTTLVDLLEKRKNDLTREYDEIRARATPSTDLRCKIDACEAVTKDIMKIIFERITEVNGEFDAKREKQALRQLLNPTYSR